MNTAYNTRVMYDPQHDLFWKESSYKYVQDIVFIENNQFYNAPNKNTCKITSSQNMYYLDF